MNRLLNIKELHTKIEALHYSCSHCGGETWNLFIAQLPEDEVRLLIQCANIECQNQQRSELDMEEEELVIWDDFDITGQIDSYNTKSTNTISN